MQVRPIIEEFGRAEGKVSKRRGRWHRWLSFLESHPELAGWRGGEPTVHPLTRDELAEVRRHKRKAVARALELFWRKNPELEALDRAHGQYERDFARSWGKRRNPDGFKHPPTLTLPSHDKHPAWYSFKRDAAYRNANLAEGTIDLKIITSDDPDKRTPRGFITYRFRPDDRLTLFRPAKAKVQSGSVLCDLEYWGHDGLPPRPARLRGAKLVFKNGYPYLHFTLYIEDAPARLSLIQKQVARYSYAWVAKKAVEQLGGPPRTMALDLGVRHIAVATVVQGEKLIATRFIHRRPGSLLEAGQVSTIPTLPQIAAMKRELRRRRRQRGKPVRGEASCRRLQAHITHMADDRFKKSASAIIDVARGHKVDIILVERLKGFIPDASRERGINRALISWNRGQLVQWLKMLAPDFGLRVVEVPAFWTSQVCHRCDHLGQRFSEAGGELHAEWVGKLFGCPSCGYQCNADFNASMNLHRIFLGTFPEVRKVGKVEVSINGQVVDREDVRRTWEAGHRQAALDDRSPFY